MKQLIVKDMIENIEEIEKKKENKEETKEEERKRKKTGTSKDTNPRSNPDRTNVNPNGRDEEVAKEISKKVDGGHINVRTGLRKRTNDLKNGQNFEGNGDGKMQGILELGRDPLTEQRRK